MLFDEAFEAVRVPTSGGGMFVRHGGSGPPLLLVHGYPQTHAMWHAVAARLHDQFHLVCPDLRGYGDSDTPPGESDHRNYAKRAMAQDMVEVMDYLGHDRFAVAGHDRGGRVTHRLALDHPQRLRKACVIDIVPTRHMFRHTDQHFATGYYHWFFLIQPGGLPEHLIGADPDYFLREKLRRWSAPGARFHDDAVAEYLRCFRKPEVIHASCEDYRAAAGIDLEHDEADAGRRIEVPLLVLWGRHGFVNRSYDVLKVWRDYATDVSGTALDSGHFPAEETPDEVVQQFRAFFGA